MNIKDFLCPNTRFIILIVSVINFSFAYFQKTENKIYWNANRLLTWDDFIEKAQTDGKNEAISSTGVSFSAKIENTKLEIDIICYFDKKKSWVKINSKDENGLIHEQGHFNISEIFARKFRKTIIESKFKTKTLNNKLKNMADENMNELNKYQDLYDKETDHYRNDVKQIEWNSKIAKELKDLENYNESHIVIKVK